MSVVWMLVISLGAVVASLIVWGVVGGNKRGSTQQMIADELGVILVDSYVSGWDGSALVVGVDKALLMLIQNGERHIASFSEILKVDLMHDESVTTSTDRASALSRLAVGGLLFGPIGSAVGAVTASKTSIHTPNRIAVRVITSLWTGTVTFLDVKGAHVSAFLLNSCQSEAEQFYAKLLRAAAAKSRP